MTTQIRKLPVTYEHDGREEIGGLRLAVGEYYGFAEEHGLTFGGGEVEWGHPTYHLAFGEINFNVSWDVAQGRIKVRTVDVGTVLIA